MHCHILFESKCLICLQLNHVSSNSIILLSVFVFLREKLTSCREYFCYCLHERFRVCVKQLPVKNPNCPLKFRENLILNLISIRERKTKLACVKTKKCPWKILKKSLNVPFFANVFYFFNFYYRIQRFFILLIQKLCAWN